MDVERKVNARGSNAHWRVFNYVLALIAEYWEQESQLAPADSYCAEFVTFLHCLKCRCTTTFPIDRYRTLLSEGLRQKRSYVRALSFRHKRTGDVSLLEKIKELRRENRTELLVGDQEELLDEKHH